ncbi:hypothetical protein ISN75_09645 [Dyella marensis]|uniref:hypothetical protein n=1 Tax=Dyella TaxID=231454 RepID=UPI0014467C08|nr:hypothetical protein [Dyella sp. SG609]NKJ20493.1 hypothetical protein [Dyella sp. SG609]
MRLSGVGGGLLALLALLFVGLLVAVAFYTEAVAPKDLATWTFPFVGTLLGAILAFKYQGINEAMRREELRAGAINRAILVLVSQAHYLSTVQAELTKGKDTWHQISNLRAFPNPPSSHARQRAEDLTFLVERGDAHLIVQVEAVQRRYDDCILHLNIRNDLLFEIVHPMAARAGIMGKPITMEQFKQALGDMHFARWETAATNVYQSIPATLEAMPKLATKLRDAGVKWFPRRKFIERIDIPVG